MRDLEKEYDELVELFEELKDVNQKFVKLSEAATLDLRVCNARIDILQNAINSVWEVLNDDVAESFKLERIRETVGGLQQRPKQA